MATLLNMAARLDAQRRADLAANDGRVIRSFGFRLKPGQSFRSQFRDDAKLESAELLADEGGVVVVRSLEVA